LLIVEVEEVGRVIYSVRSLSFTNHPVLSSSWFKINGQGFLVPTRGQSPQFFKDLENHVGQRVVLSAISTRFGNTLKVN